jgi:hypothetical protein
MRCQCSFYNLLVEQLLILSYKKIGLPGNSIFGRLAIKLLRSDRCEAERQ